MTNIAQLLTDNGIRKAAIIDDAFDEAPRAYDLDVESWNMFWDDITAYEDAIRAIYPAYSCAEREDLQDSNEFISLLWERRESLPAGVRSTLFVNYEQKSPVERKWLNGLVDSIKSLGLECTTLGREFADKVGDADLIIIDLFLGFLESESDMQQATEGVGKLILGRESSPPLVILMSHSPRLAEKRNEFRDRAGLLGSTFRVISKVNLATDGKLEAILVRLATHYQDAKRVAGFVHAWDNGLDQARKRFIQVLRRLDLQDLAQIRALLLDFEGQDLGEYLLDVADRVLQHEIEDDDATIAAALELNKIDLSKYPAPHLSGSPDLQDLVYRMVFFHSDRLRLSEDEGKVQLQFGDVLRWKIGDVTAFSDDVSLVVTPACDLVRNGVVRVMLLSGTLEGLEPKNWSYRSDPVRTAIMILPDEGRKWIRWNLKDVKTLTWNELNTALSNEDRAKRIGRLREIYAVEIQQKLLAHYGRVGQPANLPVPFSVTVALFYVDNDLKARTLEIEPIDSAACYVGKDAQSKPVHRLVLTEQTCNHIERALQALEDGKVHSAARASLTAVKGDSGFFTTFERGEIEISPETGTKFIRGEGNKVYATIVRGGDLADGTDVSGDQKKAAFIVKVMDIAEEDAGEERT